MLRRRDVIAGAAGLGLPASGHAAAADGARITEEIFHDRHALVIQNAKMRLAVLPGGGFIADASLKSDDPKLSINPMLIPNYPTIDPYAYDRKKHAALYGDGMQHKLMSGYMGQFTCFPHFAGSSPAEFRQDYGQHGELVSVKWRRFASGSDLALRAELPMTQYGFERRVSLPADETVAYITETAENLVRYDRPVQWTQHTAFGRPFVGVDRMWADASVKNVVVGAGAKASLGDWPVGRDAQGARTDYRPFVGRTSLWTMQQGGGKAWFTIYSADFNVLLGYVFDAAENPWLLDFQENMRGQAAPWNGKAVMRGLCFGDSTVGGLRNAVTQGSNFGLPTYSWMEARGRRSKSYAIFLMEIPPGFKGVETLQAQPGSITVAERETGRLISIKSSRMW